MTWRRHSAETEREGSAKVHVTHPKALKGCTSMCGVASIRAKITRFNTGGLGLLKKEGLAGG